MTVVILARIIAGLAAAVALAAAGALIWLVWPLAGMRLPQRVWQRLECVVVVGGERSEE
jgi:hypothetical protein